jgi:hypothetical protein
MGMREMPKLKPKTTHAHKKIPPNLGSSKQRFEPKKITNKSIYVYKYNRL